VTNPFDLFKEFTQLAKSIGPSIILAHSISTGIANRNGEISQISNFDLILIDYIDRLSPLIKKQIINENLKNS